MLRFRDLGASCFGLRFRVLRFRNYPCGMVIKADAITKRLLITQTKLQLTRTNVPPYKRPDTEKI